MRILTLDNTAYEMNDIPEEIDEVRFCVLDNSDPKDPDYFYIPLILVNGTTSRSPKSGSPISICQSTGIRIVFGPIRNTSAGLLNDSKNINGI